MFRLIGKIGRADGVMDLDTRAKIAGIRLQETALSSLLLDGGGASGCDNQLDNRRRRSRAFHLLSLFIA